VAKTIVITDYEQASFQFKLGKYRFQWRLFAFPLNMFWKRSVWPLATDYWIAVKNPPEETEVAIAEMRRLLVEDPDDVMNQFTLGNMLRMDGQIAEARKQYQIVAAAKHESLSPQARKVLAGLVDVPDHPGRGSVRIIYRKPPFIFWK